MQFCSLSSKKAISGMCSIGIQLLLWIFELKIIKNQTNQYKNILYVPFILKLSNRLDLMKLWLRILNQASHWNLIQHHT